MITEIYRCIPPLVIWGSLTPTGSPTRTAFAEVSVIQAGALRPIKSPKGTSTPWPQSFQGRHINIPKGTSIQRNPHGHGPMCWCRVIYTSSISEHRSTENNGVDHLSFKKKQWQPRFRIQVSEAPRSAKMRGSQNPLKKNINCYNCCYFHFKVTSHFILQVLLHNSSDHFSDTGRVCEPQMPNLIRVPNSDHGWRSLRKSRGALDLTTWVCKLVC